MKKIIAILSLSLSILSSPAWAFQTIVVVRHAEKVDESRDPLLSTQGQKRAQDLSRVLRDANIEQVYVTEFQRTQATAKPLADLRQLPLTPYSAKESLALGAQLREAKKNTLVVGHSNTINTVLKGLGIDNMAPVADDEFDRLVIVTLSNERVSSATVLRY
ncbi:histidine phosphatase family protein [Undibacterium sp. Ji22W]|uniref:histidine phosphatase family protein n=1 Tax=Undibacterium sp. Ji22W TaxID=3413038 RepID=UPI003BEF87B7